MTSEQFCFLMKSSKSQQGLGRCSQRKYKIGEKLGNRTTLVSALPCRCMYPLNITSPHRFSLLFYPDLDFYSRTLLAGWRLNWPFISVMFSPPCFQFSSDSLFQQFTFSLYWAVCLIHQSQVKETLHLLACSSGIPPDSLKPQSPTLQALCQLLTWYNCFSEHEIENEPYSDLNQDTPPLSPVNAELIHRNFIHAPGLQKARCNFWFNIC